MTRPARPPTTGRRPPTAGRRPHASPGMTLIEVMLALSIAAGIATFIYVSARDVTKTKARIEGDAERVREAQAALDMFGRDLRSAWLSGHKKPLQPIVDSVFVGEDDDPIDRVTLTTFTHLHRLYDANDSDQADVSWFGVDDPDDGRVMHLARRESASPDDTPLEGGETRILVHDVVLFELQYYDVERDEWEDEWDTTQATAQPQRLPLQVRVLLTLVDRFGGEINLATQFPLEMQQPILLPGGFQ
ncbi:MAG: prepilin-type N-terminal cleavage/methylation domain-containing protein [Deltaproteobacteria bacterium]|nr:prepilin-type N-terminal cleavage/methylation domain-containing protein [Deltaproteobacteria bacterium]